MRVSGLMVMVLWLPGGVLAAPEPPPPGDYPGAQYIDRTGCVFLRDQSEWSPRLDRNGQPVCGFPPSRPAEQIRAEPAPASPEEILAATMAEGLRPGDLTDTAPAEALRDIPAGPDQRALAKTLALESEMDQRLRGITVPDAPAGLCARLGYRPATGNDILTGGDVTRGLCPGMVADPGLALTIAVAGTSTDQTAGTERPDRSDQTKQPPATTPAKTPPARSDVRRSAENPAATGALSRRRDRPSRPAPATAAEMIPAHARYVQIGIYVDEDNAQSALRGLSTMGYRVAQRPERVGDRTAKAILAGPFGDRQALVQALNRVRANGFPRAVAR